MTTQIAVEPKAGAVHPRPFLSEPAVFTYYEPVAGLPSADGLITLWRESWQKQGWEPIVLDESNAAQHPSYETFLKAVSRLPTINKPRYELACYLRHLAMAQGEGGLLVDYDVINRFFAPDMADGILNGRPLVILEPTRVPCAVLGTQQGFEDLCDLIYDYELKPTDKAGNDAHISDMEIFRQTKLPCMAHCVEHLCSGEPKRDHLGDSWKRAPLIHFSGFSFRKLGWSGPKELLIRRALDAMAA